MAAVARSAATRIEAERPVGGSSARGDDVSPYSEADIQLPASDEAEDTVFLPPEETPIPERRFGGILPRRDR